MVVGVGFDFVVYLGNLMLLKINFLCLYGDYFLINQICFLLFDFVINNFEFVLKGN